MMRASVLVAILLATFAARGAAQAVVPRPGERIPLPAKQQTWSTKAVRTAPMTVTSTGGIAGWQTRVVRAPAMQITGVGALAAWQTKTVRAPALQVTGTGGIAGWQTKSIHTAPMQVTGVRTP